MHPRPTALERERECQNPVLERQLCSGDVGFVIRRSSPYYTAIEMIKIVNSLYVLAEIFDEDGNGEVDFKEFIQGVSQFSVKGDKDTKLR